MTSPSTQRLARLLTVIPYFHNHGSVDIHQAARELDVSVADLRRDLALLWMCGLPGYGPGELIDLSFSAEDLRDADTVSVTFTAGIDRPLRLTLGEAVTLETSLAAIADHPGIVSPVHLQSVRAKLAAATAECGPTTPESAGPLESQTGGTNHEDEDDCAALLRQALAHRSAVRFIYFSATSESTTTRIVDPERLVAKSGHTYLHGYCRQAQGSRSFRLDRIRGVEIVGPRFEHGYPSDLAEEPHEAKTTPVEIIEGAQWVIEEGPFCDPHRLSDGSTRADLRYFSTDWLIRYLLGHAPMLTALDPSIAQQVKDRATATLEMYQLARTRHWTAAVPSSSERP